MLEWKKWPIKEFIFDNYPDKLKQVQNPPKKIFYRGKISETTFDNVVAVVGSRRMTRYGKQAAALIVPELIRGGYKIISGFMYGIDSEAHRLTVEYKGTALAVLGTGLNILSPPENDSLYTQILEGGGAVMSELPNGYYGTKWTFPKRNRLVAGLSDKIIVIEAGLNSGSLITARIGRELNREVWSVPGPIISAVSAGTNWLLAENKANILNDISSICKKKSSIQDSLFDIKMDNDEQNVVNCLRDGPLSADELGVMLKKASAQISSLLSKLSLAGIVDEENGKYYCDSRSIIR